ncbi:MAG: YhfC family glutamic-type intramembrane protease [Polyangiaceae bacterium]
MVAIKILLTIVESVLCLAAPFFAARWMYKRSPHVENGASIGFSGGLIGAGVISFIASQVVHIPMLQGLTLIFERPWFPRFTGFERLLFNGVVLGLAAGLCEEIARWVVLVRWKKTARSRWAALQLGIGHGGIEAAFVGVSAAQLLISMLAMRGVELTHLVPAEQLAAAQKQYDSYWNAAWFIPLVGGLERCMSMVFHLSASLLVMRAVCRNQIVWLLMAIGWHALSDGVIVMVLRGLGGGENSTAILVSELVLLGFAIVSAAMVMKLGVQAEPKAPSDITA